MPNIIEQQDLLKGLPDARLAMLMQNPAGDIPPFLVAAEAQRRQAIRQQFAGAGSNESVVDTLTKQMANAPQNIQAPAQTPPQMPPPMQPQMQPQMQAPQQGMADGGMVKRYGPGGEVFRGRAGSGGYETPTDPWGILGDVYDYAATNLGTLSENMRKFGINPTPEERAKLREESAANAGAVEGGRGILDIEYPDVKIVPGRNPLPSAPKETKPRDESSGTRDTSAENKYKAQEAAMRERLEALYAQDEPSSWEDAQKWFAMSQQIMNPDVDLLQGIVNAGAVFADASAQQSRAQREYDRSREEALLNWDMQIMQSERDAAARAAEKAADRAFEMEKLNTIGGKTLVEVYLERMKAIDKKMTDTYDVDEKARLAAELEGLQIELAQLTNIGGAKDGNVVTRNMLPTPQ